MTQPTRRRSRTIRAAALVTLGLGAAGCDDVPPDLPGAAEARLDACRAAHRRMGEDPARCDGLEQAIAREHGQTRPRFTTVAACETLFGRGACEGETLAASGESWRPALAGWSRVPGQMTAVQPVVRDKEGQAWALPEPAPPPAPDTLTPGRDVPVLPAPRRVETLDYAATARAPLGVSLAYYRLAPLYPDPATCAAEWQSCERFPLPLPTRFATQEACRAQWSSCVEVEVPADAIAVAAEQQPQQQQAGTTTPRSTWWGGYNSFWYRSYGAGIGPRYQGWTWTADHSPTAAYRPAVGTGPLRAWDSGSRSLGPASRMGVVQGGTTSRLTGATVSRQTTTVTRAGFGSTGRAYSSGG
jgi:hypothetical protein